MRVQFVLEMFTGTQLGQRLYKLYASRFRNHSDEFLREQASLLTAITFAFHSTFMTALATFVTTHHLLFTRLHAQTMTITGAKIEIVRKVKKS